MINQKVNSYQIKKEIGRGGMATVYLGENSIGKKVAIKVLEKQFFHNEQIKKRFVQEAKLMVSLDHGNICAVIGLEDNDEYCAIIMEYLEGQDLGSYVNDKGAVSEKVLLEWLEQMATAMDYAHSEKVVHRDIKPSNFFLTKKGQVKIMDFGIAKQADNMMGTRTDSKMGSVIYMSPEQIKSPKYVDYKTDIYSLGVALYHLATGNIPYDIGTESEFAVMSSITQKPLPALSDKNSRINAIIQAATQKDPKDRPNKVLDLLSITPQVSDATIIETSDIQKEKPQEIIVTDDTIIEAKLNADKENKTEIKNGFHEIEFENGDWYHGEYKNDEFHGKGKYIWADNGIYNGNWIEGEFHGEGTLYYANGNQYHGNWLNGKKTGEGTFTWSNGDEYIGGYLNDLFHGKGKYQFISGDFWYGVWKEGEKIKMINRISGGV
ncbi:protein kinase [Cyclobacteriaceae bacterium]|nr:protein kinase [Cyclobacteriaceae bacterium]